MVTEPVVPFQVFYCSAQNAKDKALQEELISHLSALKRQRVISDWHDYDIQAGQEREKVIATRLSRANIILLLISPDFFASDYCIGTLQKALEMRLAGKTQVIPVLLRPCDWKQGSLEDLQILPKEEKAITQWPDRDQAWLSVVRGIRETMKTTTFPVSKGTKKPKKKEAQQNLTSSGEKKNLDQLPSSHHKTINTKRALLHFHSLLQKDSTIRVLSFTGEGKMGKSHLLTKVFPDLARQHYQARCVVLDMRNPVHPLPILLQIACSQLGSIVSDRYARCYEGWLEHHKVSGKGWREEDKHHRDIHLTSLFVRELDTLGASQPALLLFDSIDRATPELQVWLMDMLLVQLSSLPHVRVILAGRSLPELHASYIASSSIYQLLPITEEEDYIDYCRHLGVQLTEQSIRDFAYACDYTPGIFTDLVLPKFLLRG